jgi:hypothetical protein
MEAGLFKLDRLRPFRTTRRTPCQSLLKKKKKCCCFSDVMRAYTKSQSTVCEDLRLALSRVSEFCPGVVLTFFGTFPGATGKTIGSTTHRYIASRMVPHDICSVFVDLLALVVDVIQKFDSGPMSSGRD